MWQTGIQYFGIDKMKVTNKPRFIIFCAEMLFQKYLILFLAYKSILMMSIFKNYIHNRFFYTGLIFIIWITFFDSNNLIEEFKLSKKLNDLQTRKQFYNHEIVRLSEEIKAFNSNGKLVEKFAREQYFMKKDNDEIYVILHDE